ncbi:MAG: hypothetical protein Q6370_010700 [Candidatus Sigynarchaeota archaeon]
MTDLKKFVKTFVYEDVRSDERNCTMNRLWILICVALSSIAGAQPAAEPTSAPPASPTTELAQPQPPPSLPLPAQPQPPPPAQPQPPPPPLAQPQPPPPPVFAPSSVYQPRPLEFYRNGLTFEANLGLGGTFSHNNETGENSDTRTVGAGALGLGWFANPNLAIGVRSTASLDSDESTDQNGVTVTTLVTDSFFGPNVQYWFPNRAWVGGGIGWGHLEVTAQASSPGSQPLTIEIGLDGAAVNARAGYTLTTSSESTWNISVEMWSGFYREDDFDGDPFSVNTYNFAVLFGYQHL